MQWITVDNFSIPAIGFGTFQLEGDDVVHMVEYALNIGYRHLDTAQIYGNEAEVGLGIQKSSISREKIFVTSKVWIDSHSQEKLAPSIDESLSKLGTDYLDLLLLHWHNPDVPLEETLKALMAVKKAGKSRYIGISNFTTTLMEKAETICGKGVLVNNQVEYHPYLWQDKILDRAKKLNMSVTAYMPLAKGKVLADKTLTDIGAKYKKSNTQITLRWLIQQGVVAIPSSRKELHAKENFNIFDFQLSNEDMDTISAMRGDVRIVSPEKLAPEWDTNPYSS